MKKYNGINYLYEWASEYFVLVDKPFRFKGILVDFCLNYDVLGTLQLYIKVGNEWKYNEIETKKDMESLNQGLQAILRGEKPIINSLKCPICDNNMVIVERFEKEYCGECHFCHLITKIEKSENDVLNDIKVLNELILGAPMMKEDDFD